MAESESASMGRSIVRWIGGTTVIMFVVVGAVVLSVTGEPVDAVVVGAFAAAWGGPAFGAMFGAGAHAIREDDVAKAAGVMGANHARIGRRPELVED